MREAAEAEIPRGARPVAKLAEANGWSVTAMYARGTTMDRYGRPGKLVDSLSLRMDRGEIYIAALWVDARFKLSWRCPPKEFPVAGNTGELRKWLRELP